VRDRTLELEIANRELEAFSYSVSHDLKTPLNSIGGFAALLGEILPSGFDQKAKTYLGYIVSETGRMAGLIEDMLRLAKLSRVELHREPLSLSRMAEEMVARLRAAGPARNASITIQPGLEANGDAGLLRIVLENLLANAWKYSSKRECAEITFGRVTPAEGATAFFVRDNGAGFDMKYADRLFAPFQRLHEASEFTGTGVGLATVQRIIHRHGGRIWAEAAKDHGATFYFTLPDQSHSPKE
jgi:light-regulated signal transduction histidine kinase (bacteriophytochrome)